MTGRVSIQAPPLDVQAVHRRCIALRAFRQCCFRLRHLYVDNRIRFGLAVRNIGPDRVTREGDDVTGRNALALTVATAIGHRDKIDDGNVRVLAVSTELSFELVSYFRGEPYSRVEGELRAGGEMQLLKSFAVRLGHTANVTEGLYVLSWGFGASLLNHFDFGICWELDYNQSGVDTAEYLMSVSLTRALCWRESDRRWWLRDQSKPRANRAPLERTQDMP